MPDDASHELPADLVGLLPHRPPFRFVDAVDAIEPALRCARATASPVTNRSSPGHFPGNPVFPGVLQLEALAQTGAIAVLADARYADKLPLFGGVEDTRFRRIVRPGDELVLEVTMERLERAWRLGSWCRDGRRRGDVPRPHPLRARARVMPARTRASWSAGASAIRPTVAAARDPRSCTAAGGRSRARAGTSDRPGPGPATPSSPRRDRACARLGRGAKGAKMITSNATTDAPTISPTTNGTTAKGYRTESRPGGMMHTTLLRPSGGMADTTDSKSVARKGVWVQVPPRARRSRTSCDIDDALRPVDGNASDSSVLCAIGRSASAGCRGWRARRPR